MCQDAPGALSYRTNSPRLPSWLASFELATSQDPPSLLSHRTHSPSPSWLESSKLSNGEDTLSTLSHRTPSSPWLASFELATSHDTPDTLRYRTPSPPWLASFELATNHNAPNTPPYRTPSPHLPSWLASFELATNQDAPSTLSYRSPTSHAVPSSPSMSEQNFPPNSTSQLPPSFIDRSYNTSNPYPLQSKSKLAAPWNASAMSYPQVQNRTDRSPSVVHQSMKGGTDDPDFLMPSLSASNTTLTQGDQRMPGVVDLTNKIRIIENEKLGVGGFSEVFKAIYNINQCTTGVVAVKKLTITNFKSRSVTEAASRLKKRLYREVNIWRSLNHPNIVRLLGVYIGKPDTFPGMVMPWYQYGSAFYYLPTRRFSIFEKFTLLYEIACGLSYLHTHSPPIVHSDIKLQNVLIDNGGHAMLCDFGISRIIEDALESTGFTTSGVVEGSLRWSAPEVVSNDEPTRFTQASDIWSFGCTGYEIFAGNIPYYECQSPGPIVIKIGNGETPTWPIDDHLDGNNTMQQCNPTSGGYKHIPDPITSFISSRWKLDPNKRGKIFEIVDEMRLMLLFLLEY